MKRILFSVIVLMLTIAAAGSETSDSAVLTIEDTGKKMGF